MIAYAFINRDKSVYPEGSAVQDFCNDECNYIVMYPLESLGEEDEANDEEFEDKYGKLLTLSASKGLISNSMEWMYEHEDGMQEQAREYLNSLGFQENNILLDRIDEIPIG